MALSTTKDYYRINWVGNGDLSADGAYLAYCLTHVEEPDREVSKIVLRERATGAETEVAEGFDPSFSPDGSRLLYTRKVAGVEQAFVLSLADCRETQLTHLRFGAHGAVWSPDGAHVAVTSRVDLSCPEDQWGHEAGEADLAEAALLATTRPYVEVTEWGYKSDEDGGFSCERAWTLWVADVAGGEVRRISDGRRDHVMPAWTPDGKSLLFVSNRCRGTEESIGMDLFRADLATGVIERLTDECWVAYYPAPFQPVVAPDGSFVVIGALEPSLAGGMPLTRLFRVELGPVADGEKRAIKALWPDDAPCHEATCFLYNCENEGVGERHTAAIDAEGAWVYFVSGWHGAANLYRASLDANEPRIETVTSDAACYRSVAIVGDELLASRGDWTHTPQLLCGKVDEVAARGSQALEPLTRSNEWFEQTLVAPEELWVKTLDAQSEVQGWVFAPQGAEKGKRYPAVAYIHGGPTPFMGAALTYEHQCILGAGMGLVIMNFRGSSGYGEAHEDMAKAQDGTAMTDILQFVDAACQRFDWIDPDRLGITGGSFGGYMTNWICGHTKRFKAGVTQRSIANDLIMYASSDMPASSKDYADFSDFMMERLKTSPVSYAENIDVPFLILHGTNDMRCPVENAHQLFSAIKECHPENPVRMVLFPGMTHSFPMSGPMDLRIAHYDAMIEWFEKYL